MAEGTTPLLMVRGLSKLYSRPAVRALNGVDLDIAAGRTLALVGQSGSGKSTLARCVARLEEPAAGEIWFGGQDILRLQGRALLPVRKGIQVIFQDPATVFNPRFPAAAIVSEPLVIQGWGTKADRRRRALDLMRQVRLPADCADRPPREFSGGQRQRLALARALATEPRLLILDEALSGLDLPAQTEILALLRELQQARGLAFLFICHDLGLAGRIADEVAVMFEGSIVERAAPAGLSANPRHPHTRALLSAIPRAVRAAD